MAYTNNETLMEQNVFQLPMLTANDAEFSKDDLAEDRDGMQLSLPRVKIPSGGALQFELPGSDPENPDYAKTLEGVILFQHAACAYWQEGSEYDDNATPLCSSVDGKVGIGTPGGTCASCEFNQFRSASDGKAKACKNMRHLYLLRSGDYIPLQVVLPPTSLRPYQDFYNLAFALRNRAIYGSVVQIGLKRADNGTNIYSVATFKKLYDFTGEQLAFRSAVMNFLHSEGFVPKVDTRDESIEFKKEGERYWIYVEESSPFYVTLQREGYSIEADQAAKSKEIANRVNRTKKAAKVYVSEASVTFVVEMFAPSAESFEKVFYRTMEQVDAAHDQFTEEYNSTED